MRDINRIKPFMELLTELWLESPDLRFGQLISNISFKVKDNGNIFYVEDNELLREIKLELFDSIVGIVDNRTKIKPTPPPIKVVYDEKGDK